MITTANAQAQATEKTEDTYAKQLAAHMTVDQLLFQYASKFRQFDETGSERAGMLLDLISDEIKSRISG